MLEPQFLDFPDFEGYSFKIAFDVADNLQTLLVGWFGLWFLGLLFRPGLVFEGVVMVFNFDHIPKYYKPRLIQEVMNQQYSEMHKYKIWTRQPVL